MIKIALCTDTYYMMACGPCVVSIFEHHRKVPCHIYVITKALPQVDVEGLEEIATRYGGLLTVKVIEPEIVQGLKVSDRFGNPFITVFFCRICFRTRRRCFIWIAIFW